MARINRVRHRQATRDPELLATLEVLRPPSPDGHRQIVTSGDRLTAVLGTAGFAFEPATGGMFLFLVLPEGAKIAGLFEGPLEQKVLHARGSAFALERRHFRFGNRLRLCFAGLDAENLGTAAARSSPH